MKKIFVASLLLLVGSFGCGQNFEWFPVQEPITSATLRGYSTVFVSSTITANPNTSRPVALAVGGGTVYAADVTNNRILKYDATTGTFISTFGVSGTGNKEFTSPRGVAFDGTNLLVADFPNIAGNGRIQIFTTADNFVGSFGNNGVGGIVLKQIYALTFSKRTNSFLYVTEMDTGKVRQFAIDNVSAPQFVREWGSVGAGIDQLLTPHGLTVSSSGIVFIADTGNNRLLQTGFDGSNPVLFPTVEAESPVSSPEGIVLSGGQIYVADSGKNRVAVYDASTLAYVTSFGTLGEGRGQFTGPLGIAADGTGAIYVSDTKGRIQKFVKKP